MVQIIQSYCCPNVWVEIQMIILHSAPMADNFAAFNFDLLFVSSVRKGLPQICLIKILSREFVLC